MRGNGSQGRVVLVFQALPNCGQPNGSIASRIRPILRGMVLKHVPTNPVVDPAGATARSRMGRSHVSPFRAD